MIAFLVVAILIVLAGSGVGIYFAVAKKEVDDVINELPSATQIGEVVTPSTATNTASIAAANAAAIASQAAAEAAEDALAANAAAAAAAAIPAQTAEEKMESEIESKLHYNYSGNSTMDRHYVTSNSECQIKCMENPNCKSMATAVSDPVLGAAPLGKKWCDLYNSPDMTANEGWAHWVM
jgi:hypothetical protein